MKKLAAFLILVFVSVLVANMTAYAAPSRQQQPRQEQSEVRGASAEPDYGKQPPIKDSGAKLNTDPIYGVKRGNQTDAHKHDNKWYNGPYAGDGHNRQKECSVTSCDRNDRYKHGSTGYFSSSKHWDQAGHGNNQNQPPKKP